MDLQILQILCTLQVLLKGWAPADTPHCKESGYLQAAKKQKKQNKTKTLIGMHA